MQQSIADFAENLLKEDLEQIKTGKKLPPKLASVSPDSSVPDISNVEVPDSFIQEITGTLPTSKVSKPKLQVEHINQEDTLLIERKKMNDLITVLEQLTSKLREMTSVGMLGVNMGGPGLSSKEREDCSEPKKKKSLKLKLKGKLKK